MKLPRDKTLASARKHACPRRRVHASTRTRACPRGRTPTLSPSLSRPSPTPRRCTPASAWAQRVYADVSCVRVDALIPSLLLPPPSHPVPPPSRPVPPPLRTQFADRADGLRPRGRARSKNKNKNKNIYLFIYLVVVAGLKRKK
jgi:hypothetical protein